MTPEDAELIQAAKENLARRLAEGDTRLDLTREIPGQLIAQAVDRGPGYWLWLRSLDWDEICHHLSGTGTFLLGILLELGWTHPDLTIETEDE